MKIIPRDQHKISRANINENALKTLYHLKNNNFDAFLVGGSVRDLLLDLEPKDYDIATNATPEQTKSTFKNCRLIGRRFRLAHIYFGREIIEVATFRGKPEHHSEAGVILRDNVYGTMEEDAWRRDFTINALYYNIKDFSIVDYTGGIDDLNTRTIRIIGDPQKRYQEDPVRILRALRMAAKLNFNLAPATEKNISAQTGMLTEIAPARLLDEVIKWFYSGSSLKNFRLLQQHGLIGLLFPRLVKITPAAQSLLVHCFQDTDKRLAEEMSINSAFLFAALFWNSLQSTLEIYQTKKLKIFQALQLAATDVLSKQQLIPIPYRLQLMVKDIWFLQYRLAERNSKKISRLLQYPRFRAAYDFLLLRAKAGENTTPIVSWWQQNAKLDKI